MSVRFGACVGARCSVARYGVALPSSVHSWVESRRLLCSTTVVCHRAKVTAAPHNSGETPTATISSFANVGDKLTSLRMQLISLKAENRGNDAEAQRCVREAWETLHAIPDEEASLLPTSDLAEILICYTFFSRHWERGLDGPAKASSSSFGRAPGSRPAPPEEEAKSAAQPEYRSAQRWEATAATGTAAKTNFSHVPQATDVVGATKRASPLDEILDF